MPVTCTNYKLKCGGCPLLNQPYPDQLKHKQQLEQRLLGRFAPVSPVLGQAEPWHYRNKAIATFAMQRGKLVLGLYAEGSHRVLPGCNCLLQNKALNQTLAAILDAARACRWAAYDEDRGTGLVRHAVLRASREGKVLVTIVTARPELPGSRNFCSALRKAAPWVVGIVPHKPAPCWATAKKRCSDAILWQTPCAGCNLRFPPAAFIRSTPPRPKCCTALHWSWLR